MPALLLYLVDLEFRNHNLDYWGTGVYSTFIIPGNPASFMIRVSERRGSTVIVCCRSDFQS